DRSLSCRRCRRSLVARGKLDLVVRQDLLERRNAGRCVTDRALIHSRCGIRVGPKGADVLAIAGAERRAIAGVVRVGRGERKREAQSGNQTRLHGSHGCLLSRRPGPAEPPGMSRRGRSCVECEGSATRTTLTLLTSTALYSSDSCEV